jgi:glycosyltransferase involved in cell wall biosynthesis
MSWAGSVQLKIGKSAKCGTSARASAYRNITSASDHERPVLLCLSHLRWDFVYQRPQHLMSRFARDYRLLFWEEPVSTRAGEAWLEVREDVEDGVQVLVPHLPEGQTGRQSEQEQRRLLDRHLFNGNLNPPLLWYYTPMSLAFTEHLRASLVVYDCMDQLSAFRGAPPQLVERERRLMARADLVFTGGYSLYEAKRELHDKVHPFPSSVDIEHFAQAREDLDDPEDQAAIPHPRLGFYGVIDERLDLQMIDQLARRRPELQLVLIGPVVKIDPAMLPRHPNIHYLGPKAYDELPLYLAGWDVALMPFALNESTRYISPTKTPEYLAGGCPVVSTPITDVVRSYGDTGVVKIAGSADEFSAAIDMALREARRRKRLLQRADQALADMSWDRTWRQMKQLIASAQQDDVRCAA